MNRRDFLGKSALALTTAGLSQVPSTQASTPMGALSALSTKTAVGANDKVRVGLIGCGGMGRGDLNTFFMNPEVDCPIICDIDDAQIAKTAKMVEGKRGKLPDTVKDFRRVIDRNDIDVCLVATPDHWHALPMIYACQAGKDVYVEKPLGRTIQEGRAMLEAQKQNNRVVQMGTQWRSGKHYGEAVDFIQSGKLGKIRMVRTWAYLDWLGGVGNPPDGPVPAGVDYDMWLGPAPVRPFNPNRFHFNFRWFWDYAGGLMTDWGVHLLNVCLWAMGPETPLRVSSSGGRHVLTDNSETPDTQVTVYDFPSYTLIFEHQIQGGLGPGGRPHGMLFNGTEGTLIIDSQGWEVIPEPKKNSLEAAKHPAGPDARPAHVRNFLDCVNTREKPVENLEIAHFVSSIAHLGNIAMRSQSEIAWDPKKERITGSREAKKLLKCNYQNNWKLPYA